jgi:hypothetical protein
MPFTRRPENEAVALSNLELETAPLHVARLATHAALLEAWLRLPADRLPPRWRTAEFGRMVDLVRTHLRPIANRQLLGLSYGREHFHVVAVGDPPAPTVLMSRNATEVAYAVRWLELGGAAGVSDWPSLIGAD